ncbi:MAG: hypothetical protein JNJ47_05425, partial [Alphaproteobacteria bacterium]|nr:hypothetical protein [Alphaproteobacteria bacterium]
EFFHPHYVKLTNENSYYFSFFEILQKLHPNPNLQKIISSFKDFYDHSNKLAENSSLQTGTEIKNRERHKIPFVQAKYVCRFSKKTYILIALIISMGILGLAYIFFSKNHPTEQSKTLIRSDLILPKKATLLQRPELIKQISERFKNQKDIQTVALVGVGGAGKTILARQYAHEVKAPIMWEVNAESKTNLLISFKNLAYGLSKSEEDKKVLKEIEEIKALHIREDKTILFVKEHLRLHPDWLLIYDNVENFTDLQKYFPNDPETWGEGKILITTKNANIEANIHINHIIPVGELREDQKIDLFTNLVNDGKNSHLAIIQKEEILAFLNQIPPFPLDISVAAHYLKTVGITYKKYLERLIHYDNNFAAVEKNLLKEAGEYTQTRHGIITLSLEHLMQIHQDFRDLLLLISCIGSQNISRELLDKCKPESVVDNFIYHLKKHSIIATTLSYHSEPTFSIHRSIQSIILEYFVKMLTLETNKNSFQFITNTLESYATDLINKKEYIKLKKLSSHLEVLLSHNDLFSSEMSQPIRTKLGSIYFHLGYDIQAKYLLEDGLQNLHKKSLKNYTNIAQISTELGNMNKPKIF